MKKSSNVIAKRGSTSSNYSCFHENGVKELANERAALASRAAASEAANHIREQERQVQLKAMSAIAERRLEDNYSEMLVRLREECDFQMQQNEFLLQQIKEAQNLQKPNRLSIQWLARLVQAKHS